MQLPLGMAWLHIISQRVLTTYWSGFCISLLLSTLHSPSQHSPSHRHGWFTTGSGWLQTISVMLILTRQWLRGNWFIATYNLSPLFHPRQSSFGIRMNLGLGTILFMRNLRVCSNGLKGIISDSSTRSCVRCFIARCWCFTTPLAEHWSCGITKDYGVTIKGNLCVTTHIREILDICSGSQSST